MTPAEQRERDARKCDEVAAKWRAHEEKARTFIEQFEREGMYYATKDAYTSMYNCALRAEAAEECARRIRSGEG